MNADRTSHDAAGDAELERRLGTRAALLALWSPSGQPVSVSCDDSSIVTATDETRTRLVSAHVVVHALLRRKPADAAEHLAHMSSLMTVFTALRSMTLASSLLWDVASPTWTTVLASARTEALAVVAGNTASHAGVDALARTIRRNLDGEERQRILDSVAETAAGLPPAARCGLGGFGAAVLAVTLRATARLTLHELVAEHAALIVALGRGQTVTHRDGRLVIDG